MLKALLICLSLAVVPGAHAQTSDLLSPGRSGPLVSIQFYSPSASTLSTTVTETGSVGAGAMMRAGALAFGTEVEASNVTAVSDLCAVRATGCAEDVARFGAVRAMLGVQGDDTLFYARAGLAVADVVVQGGSVGDSFRTHSGIVAGLGFRQDLTARWRFDGEISYHRFDLGLPSDGGTPAVPEHLSARIGLGFSF